MIFGLAANTFDNQVSWFINAVLQAIRVVAKFLTFKMPFESTAAPDIVLQPALIVIDLFSNRILIGSVEASFLLFLFKVTEVDLKVSASTSEKLISFDLVIAALAVIGVENGVGNEIGKRTGTIARSAIAITFLLIFADFIFSLTLFLLAAFKNGGGFALTRSTNHSALDVLSGGAGN